MYKQEIINAIQNREWLNITFQRKRDDNYVNRIIAPYDVFVQEGGEYDGEDRLLGYTKAHEDYRPGIISLYLSEITSINGVRENFDGREIRNLINPKKPPQVPRNW